MLKDDLTSRYGKVLGKEDDLQRRVLAFASCSEATISMLKRKYDELRIDFEQLRWQSNTTAVQRESTFAGMSVFKSLLCASDGAYFTIAVKAEPKEESATMAVIAGPIPSTSTSITSLSIVVFILPVYILLGQVQVKQSGEEGYWKQRFQALSDGSDSTIQLLKKENQRLKVELERQSHTQMEQANTIVSVKQEPLEEVTLAEIPPNSTSPSAAGKLK